MATDAKVAQKTNKTVRWPRLKEVQITLFDNGNFSVSPYASNQLQYFENVTISSWNFRQIRDLKCDKLTNFMLQKCNQYLSKICIVGEIALASFGQKTDLIFRNVRAVEFQNRRGAVDEAQFLKHCRNLRKLILGVEINNENVDAILGQRYRLLTHFYYLNGNGKNLNAEKLQVFFRINEQIQSIVWKMRMFDKCARHHFVKCVQTLGHAEHLQHLHLCFSNKLSKFTPNEFEDIYQQLNELCERETFKFFEIELHNDILFNDDDESTILTRMKRFSKWKQFIKIHLHYFTLPPMIPTISELAHLNSIALTNCNFNYTRRESDVDSFKLPGEVSIDESDTSIYNIMDDNIAMELPQILRVKINNTVSRPDLGEICMPYVRHWRNLKAIHVRANDYGVTVDIADLNEAREKLKDACELTIFTNHKSISTNLEHKLVKLQCNSNR